MTSCKKEARPARERNLAKIIIKATTPPQQTKRDSLPTDLSARVQSQPWRDRSACPRRRRGRPSSPSTTSPSSESRLRCLARRWIGPGVDFFGGWPKINLNAMENDWSPVAGVCNCSAAVPPTGGRMGGDSERVCWNLVGSVGFCESVLSLHCEVALTTCLLPLCCL